jgi:DNA-binding CsgD family transcriptional regulator
MVLPSDMLDVIAEIHQAGLEPKRWSSVIVRIAELMGANCGSFHFLDRSTGDLDVFGSHGFDPAACRGYQEHYYRIDRLTEAVLRFPPGLCFVGQQLVDLENFEGSEFYRDFLSPLGMCHFVGGRTLEAEGVAAMVGFHRSTDRGPFDPCDATTLGLLFPHLAHAALVHSRMTEMHAHVEALKSIHDRWPTGVILTEADGVVVWCNRTAEAILRHADGLHMHRGHLMAEHPDANRELRELLRRAASSNGNGRFGGIAAVPRQSVADSYSVLVAPLPPHNGTPNDILNRPLAVVFLCDPAQLVRTPAEALRRLYRLTPAEARLAEALMAGNRLRDAADQLKITEHTARSYLKRVLHKTGAQRQSDLVRVVLSGLGPLAAAADDARPLVSMCEGIDR